MKRSLGSRGNAMSRFFNTYKQIMGGFGGKNSDSAIIMIYLHKCKTNFGINQI